MTASSNPFRGPARAPEWAALTRLGGDRVAVLLKMLRTEAGKVAGLKEEISSDNPAAVWTISYSIAKEPLFTLTVRPGSLEWLMPADSSHHGLPAPAVTPTQPLPAPLDVPDLTRVQIATARDVRSLMKLVTKRSRRIQPGDQGSASHQNR